MHHLMKKHLDRTLWKFLLVGTVNTVVGTGIMFVFYNVLHLSYWLSSASNYVFGSVLSYLPLRSRAKQAPPKRCRASSSTSPSAISSPTARQSRSCSISAPAGRSSRRKILRCWWVCVSSWG